MLEKYKGVFDAQLLAEIESRSKIISVNQDTTILEIGQPILAIPLLTKGTLRVTRMGRDGKEILLYYIKANESCAMTFTCCMKQSISEIKAVAETDVEFIAIPISVMDEWLIKFPSWKNFVMLTIKNRFNEMLNAIDQLAFEKLDERLVSYLKEKSSVTGSSLINLSHEQIAHELASSREVISRLLKKLENDNKVLLYRNQLKILRDL